jgi:hypothetical protein
VSLSEYLLALRCLPRYFLPWLSNVLSADAVDHKNTRERVLHPRILHEGEGGTRCHYLAVACTCPCHPVVSPPPIPLLPPLLPYFLPAFLTC